MSRRLPEDQLQRFLQQWVDNRVVSATVGIVARRSEVLWHGSATSGRRAPTIDTLFDAASLTKPLMATLALVLEQRRNLELGTELGSLWPECARPMAGLTLESLLRHRSQLRGWVPLYHLCRSPAAVLERLLGGDLLGARLGTYSDLGYILWGLAVEERFGTDLSRVLDAYLLQPGRLPKVRAIPGARHDVEPCCCDNGKEIELSKDLGISIARRVPAIGEPQDGNAAFLGGLAAHSGLFVSARSLLRFANVWLSALAGEESILRRSSVAYSLSGNGPYALGWARKRVRGSAGRSLGAEAFGHVGFTGTSLWMDPDPQTVMILLGHRRSPLSELNPYRRRFHRLASELASGGNDG